MKIYDESDNEIENPDLTKGYLYDGYHNTTYHEEVKGVSEEWHFEKRDGVLTKVIDVAYVPYQPAYYDTEPCKRYHEYTDAELKEQVISGLPDRVSANESAIDELVMQSLGG